MMNIFTNVVRGGQISIHALRMFRQVVYIVCLWSIGVWIVLFSYNAHKYLSMRQVGAYAEYWVARMFMVVHMGEKKVRVHVDGKKQVVQASAVVQSAYFLERKHWVELVVLESVAFGSRWAGVWIAFFLCLFVYKGFRRSGESFRRGARLREFSDVKRVIVMENWRKGYRAYSVAGMPYPHLSEGQHTLVVGTTGAGKTVLISDVVEQVRRRGGKAIVYDLKGDYVRWFYDARKDLILNPFDARSVKWRLLNDVEHPAHLKTIAQAFIPERYLAGENKIWDEAGRIAFASIVEKLMLEDPGITNEQLMDTILKQDMHEVAKLVHETLAQSIIDPTSPKTAASVMFVLAANFNCLKLIDGDEASFSIKRWVQDPCQDSMLFITSKESFRAELAPLQTVWFEIAIQGLLDTKQKHNTWFVMDELPNMNGIPSLAKALSVARSYGGCFVLGLQNIAQMKEVYGHNVTQDISSECNTRCFFKTNDPDTAKWIAQNIGDAEVREFQEGISYGAHLMRDGINLNSAERIKSLLIPSEVLNLERMHLVLKMADFPAVRTKIRYKERREISQSFVMCAEKAMHPNISTKENSHPKTVIADMNQQIF